MADVPDYFQFCGDFIEDRLDEFSGYFQDDIIGVVRSVSEHYDIILFPHSEVSLYIKACCCLNNIDLERDFMDEIDHVCLTLGLLMLNLVNCGI